MADEAEKHMSSFGESESWKYYANWVIFKIHILYEKSKTQKPIKLQFNIIKRC